MNWQYHFNALACHVSVQGQATQILDLLRQIWPADTPLAPLASQQQAYRIDEHSDGYCLSDDSGILGQGLDAQALLYQLDKAILIRLQHDNPTLYFLHGAVLHRHQHSILLTGSSGAGKSSLALALTSDDAHAWQLMSDELAPIEIGDGSVFPYRRAIGLKSTPPDPITLPDGCVELQGRYHVPCQHLTQPTCPPQSQLQAAFSIAGQFSQDYPAGARLSVSDAALIYLRNVLNSLAHQGNGLPAALALASHIPCFNIPRMPITQARSLIHSCLQRL